MTRATGTPVPSTHHAALGRYGEAVAERHLTDLGMVVVDRNWRCREGEADLILRDGDTLVVCEVKTRSSAVCGPPHAAITPAKLDRLWRIAQRWMADHDVHPSRVRIDLVAVVKSPRGAAVVEHVPGLG